MKCASFLFISLFFLVFSACEPTGSSSNSGGTDTDTTTAPVSPEPEKTVPVNVKPNIADLEKVGQTMSVAAFNDEVAKGRENGAAWTGSPLTVALKFAGEGFDCRKKNVDVESLSGGEVFDKVLVSITEDGFLDDSLRGSMVILRMEQVNGFWKITSAKKVWRCWENRGHTAFNSEPCH